MPASLVTSVKRTFGTGMAWRSRAGSTSTVGDGGSWRGQVRTRMRAAIPVPTTRGATTERRTVVRRVIGAASGAGGRGQTADRRSVDDTRPGRGGQRPRLRWRLQLLMTVRAYGSF